MAQHRIRLSETDSANSVNKDNFVDANIKQTAKLFPFPDIKDTIDQYELFTNERSSCTKYRLIVTINPFCSNVLFNTLTEIVKDEGSDGVKVVTDRTEADKIGNAYGEKTPTRVHMICNTEYSREDVGYVYHPGYDIFDNHILRNLTFKLVNTPSGSDTEGFTIGGSSSVFNTIGDFMRTMDGNQISYKKRTDISTISDDLHRHLYLNTDLLGFANGDSINTNLSEENGWVGFSNNSTVMAKDREQEGSSNWESMDISRVLNDHNSCEFIDMYPDRTLYSFNPKYNKFRHRNEYNWYLCITYPYKNCKNHPIVSNCDGDGKTNGLKIMSIQYTRGTNDNYVLLVRTYTKHGLSKNDYVYLYYSDDDSLYTRSESYYKVADVGDLDKNNTDYYFYLTDLSFLDEDEINENNLSSKSYRMRRCYNGKESEYYLRLFRKLPNFKNMKEKFEKYETNQYRLIWDESCLCTTENKTIEEYIEDNAYENGKMIDFDREQYKLAFASTIYTDNQTQVVFTDDIDINNLVDNLGRPLTEIYLTIVKNNKGHNEWYNKQDFGSEEVEYSHCFGKLSSGMKFHTEDNDSDDNALYQRAKLSDVRVLNEVGCYKAKSIEAIVGQNGLEQDTLKNGITEDSELFVGDICEFIPYKCQEVILDDCYFRFNTAQRELDSECKMFNQLTYHEIAADDYDLNDFSIEEVTMEDNIAIGGQGCDSKTRPEGYYYKPHYKMELRELGAINQGSHYDIRIKEAKPIALNDIFIQITSSLRSNVSVNDTIMICDDSNNIEYITKVVQVIDKTNFVIERPNEMNWIKLCDILNSENEDMRFKVRRKNTDIPSYAIKIDTNKYLWREVLNVGDSQIENLTEYPFANGRFYLNLDVNFFLKRQDKDGKNGLYTKNHFPNDIYGDIKAESNYEYKDESDRVC